MIPAIEELKKYPNWVCWKQVATDDGKIKKPPISAVTGGHASHSDPDDWTTYQETKEFYLKNKTKLNLGGLGFVFSDNTPFVGIDLDRCVEGGKLNEFAVRQIHTFGSYTEYSPSGDGIHIIGTSNFKFDAVTTNKEGYNIEIYSRSRFFTITGRHVDGSPLELANISQPLSYRVNTSVAIEPEQTEITIQDVREMLKYIPGTGLDYNEWLHILMAIHSQFPGAEGLAAVEDWTGAYCRIPNELSQKWKSFRGGSIGIGTLVYFAKEYGYQPPHRNVEKPTVKLDHIRPRLTPVQEEQVRDTIAQLEKEWLLYHQTLLARNFDIGYSNKVIEHFQFGIRPRKIDVETGEITPQAITVPYFMGTDVVAIEFREEDNHIQYDGQPGLYKVKPMLEEHSTYGIILPDSLTAVNTYLSGTGTASVYGLPHTELELELPNKDLYCIFDGSVSLNTLEILDAYGVKFVKVQDVARMTNVLPRNDIEIIATRGKKLNGVL